MHTNFHKHRFAYLLALLISAPVLAAPATRATQPKAHSIPSLETIQRKAFDFFWHESHPQTGLTKDRERNHADAEAGKKTVASIASTGYALASLPIAVERRWVSRQAAYQRALTTLNFVHDRLPQTNGFYFHFVDWRTGERVWNSELSSIDTSLLALGALAAGEYWRGTPVQDLANKIAGRMDWKWMQTNGGDKPDELIPSMGWNPENGFLASRWQGYSEASFLYLLGLGTPGENRLTPAAWDAWAFLTVWQEGYPVFGGPSPIFFAQMAPGYFNLRGLRDQQGRDWWLVWRNAHLADQAYCARHPQNKTYARGFWGINASDQPDGYGAESPQAGQNRGTVSPTAMLAAMVFTPNRSQKALGDMWQLRDKIWGRYGFCNAFNLQMNWYATDVIGIDLGMMLLMTENARSGFIWRLMQRNAFAQRGLAAAGFHAVPSPNKISDLTKKRNFLKRKQPLQVTRDMVIAKALRRANRFA